MKEESLHVAIVQATKMVFKMLQSSFTLEQVEGWITLYNEKDVKGDPYLQGVSDFLVSCMYGILCDRHVHDNTRTASSACISEDISEMFKIADRYAVCDTKQLTKDLNESYKISYVAFILFMRTVEDMIQRCSAELLHNEVWWDEIINDIDILYKQIQNRNVDYVLGCVCHSMQHLLVNIIGKAERLQRQTMKEMEEVM